MYIAIECISLPDACGQTRSNPSSDWGGVRGQEGRRKANENDDSVRQCDMIERPLGKICCVISRRSSLAKGLSPRRICSRTTSS